jgi:hypothetical protein
MSSLEFPREPTGEKFFSAGLDPRCESIIFEC